MKKIFLLLAFVWTVSVANAWTNACEEGIVIMAVQHLEPKAKAVVDRYLGSKYSDDIHYLYNLESKKKSQAPKEIHFVHFDENMQPMQADGEDALVALEKALAVVGNYENSSDDEMKVALRTVINLMSDIHLLSNYRFASISYSQGVHTFSRRSYDYGDKKNEISQVNWHKVWGSFSRRYTGFSAAFWAYEMNIGASKMKEEYSKGTLRDWVMETAETVAEYLTKYTPDYVMSPFEFNSLEEVNYRMMARASFRLAAVLNATIK